ncbi:MAG: efflux RND transporter periplasmic adaptor subunit [Candidatus Thiodiazotropha sp.]
MDIFISDKRSPFFLPLISCLLLWGQAAWSAPDNHSQVNEHGHNEAMPGGSTSRLDDNRLYSCPMHPGETSHQPGRCSQCGMFLVQQQTPDGQGNPLAGVKGAPVQHEDASHREHRHQASAMTYICPMHPGETSHQPGRCSQCGMFLVQRPSGSEEENQHRGLDTGPRQHTPGMHTVKQPTATSGGAFSMGMNHPMPGTGEMQAQPKPKRFWEAAQTLPTINDRQHRDKGESLLEIAKRPEASPSRIAGPDVASEDHRAAAHSHDDSIYICPMHPQITSKDADASCPICGMDLVRKSSALHQGGEPQVFLPSNVIQNMGVRTAMAKRGAIEKSVKTQGIVTADDDRIHNIHPRTGGWVERLYPITEGDRVERKEELVDFYSPWTNQVQLEFITALEEYDLISYDPTGKTELDAKVDSLRNRLRLLNVTPMELMRIEKSRKVLSTIQIKAPQGGWITDLNVTDGTYVEPYQAMFTIVDLSEVWVMVDIFEHQAPWIRKGQEVTITTATIPGRIWTGKVDYIYPQVNPKTRTLRARIEVPNPDEALLLNMFVQVDLSQGSSKKHAVTVPREAIILTGEREIVVKSLGKGHFQPVEVTSGVWGDHRVEILTGVEEGNEIVVSGQFLIDSESNIQSSLLRMME